MAVQSKDTAATDTAIKRLNHFVPRGYLKRWASTGGKLWSYRVLVSHADVPLWKPVSPRGVAYHEHLYTRIAAAGESDDLERWLDAEFESPAEEAIDRVVRERPLKLGHWRNLARFFAAQDVRTPARLVENLRRWSATLSTTLEESLQSSVARLEQAARDAVPLGAPPPEPYEGPPFRVSIERNVDGEGGLVKAETVVGRALWVWSIRHLLTHTLSVLYQHRWTILTAPAGLTWFTSDDPVIKLNFNSITDYSFGGGWGHVGTDLMLPLGPRHLLFTQVGKQVPPRGTVMDLERAILVRRLSIEHAHRHVFAEAPDDFVSVVRPRVVDAAAIEHESSQWRGWHSEQSAAERGLVTPRDGVEFAPLGNG